MNEERIRTREAAQARIALLEAQNVRAKEGIKRFRALTKLGENVDWAYADIAEAEGKRYDVGWLRNYLKYHSKLPIDMTLNMSVFIMTSMIYRKTPTMILEGIIIDNKEEIKELKRRRANEAGYEVAKAVAGLLANRDGYHLWDSRPFV